MKPLTDKQRLEAAITIAARAKSSETTLMDRGWALDLISRLGNDSSFLYANRANYQEFIPNFMEETE